MIDMFICTGCIFYRNSLILIFYQFIFIHLVKIENIGIYIQN